MEMKVGKGKEIVDFKAGCLVYVFQYGIFTYLEKAKELLICLDFLVFSQKSNQSTFVYLSLSDKDHLKWLYYSRISRQVDTLNQNCNFSSGGILRTQSWQRRASCACSLLLW